MRAYVQFGNDLIRRRCSKQLSIGIQTCENCLPMIIKEEGYETGLAPRGACSFCETEKLRVQYQAVWFATC